VLEDRHGHHPAIKARYATVIRLWPKTSINVSRS
jgi:hypothetical protein